jgi:AraC family transcriptional regulator of adaptative response/methylated-DNA-[protein]-cysteine methyltransferase
MEEAMLSPDRISDVKPLDGPVADYDIVRRAIAHIRGHWRDQPEIDEIAEAAGVTPTELHHLFRRWAGLTPKAFLQALTLNSARELLRSSSYGFHPSPFGSALVMTTERGLCGLAFADYGEEKAALDDMRSRWPRAKHAEDSARTAPIAARIFDKKLWRPDQPLRVMLIGTDFEVRVWETLMPMGRATTYSDIAGSIGNPKASRAVGAAVGKNPISFVVPCHRVLGKSGELTGYHWGITRKRAMLGWEAGTAAAA